MRDRLTRRQFIEASAVSALSAGVVLGNEDGASTKTEEPFRGGKFTAPVAVGTWNHGMTAAQAAVRVLRDGGLPIDAVERGINLVETDAGVSSVGIGGFPNEDGVVQLDAAIMTGDLRCGSVQALETISRPISVARRVMEKTRHVQLVGAGALRFAVDQRFETTELLTDDMRRRWETRKKKGRVDPKNRDADADGDHDTVGLVALSSAGLLAAGCSTSGLSWKMPGRVGDSPIVGAGLYCDGDVGGASATGVGEEVLRVCGSFLIVESMRRGASPQEAVEEALARIIKADPKNTQRQVAFIALSTGGDVGAASILPGFQVAIRSADATLLTRAHVISS